MRSRVEADELLRAVSGLPESNGSRYYRRIGVRIGIVCDRLYYDLLSSAADFVYLSPDASVDVLKTIDLLLVVTTWRGLKDREWWKMYSRGTCANERIGWIVARCRELGKPTVFYSKEDPPNYHCFLEIARQCDFVFTTAQECVDYYRKACGHDRVHVLRFCIDPKLHNPVGSRSVPKRGAVLFAGSWVRKYPRRCRELGKILDGVIGSGVGLDVIDRNSFRSENRMYRFPRRFRKYAVPEMEHGELLRVYRAYDWAVNANSVQRSFTMFASRVYELQAVGTLMISNPSLGMMRDFPDVFVVRDARAVGELLRAFTPRETYALQMAGVRRVMGGATCYDRLAELLGLVGLPVPETVRRVLVVADGPDAACRKMFDAQTYPHRTFRLRNELADADLEAADAIAFFDSERTYGRHYLEDMMNAFKYTDCDYVVCGGSREHEFTDRMGARGRVLFWREAFGWTRICELTEGAVVPNGYVIDGFSCGSAEEMSALERTIERKLQALRAKVLPEDEPTGEPEFVRPRARTVLMDKLCGRPVVGRLLRVLRRVWNMR